MITMLSTSDRISSHPSHAVSYMPHHVLLYIPILPLSYPIISPLILMKVARAKSLLSVAKFLSVVCWILNFTSSLQYTCDYVHPKKDRYGPYGAAWLPGCGVSGVSYIPNPMDGLQSSSWIPMLVGKILILLDPIDENRRKIIGTWWSNGI